MDVKKNREARRAMAAKICRSKKPIDNARKALKAKIDETARDCGGKLEVLETEARSPLTEWEDEEKIWKEYQVIAYGWTSDLVLGRLECAKETPCSPSLKDEKEKAILALSAAYQRILQEEENAAELSRLREKEAAEARLKDEEDRQAAELAAALDAKAASRPDFACVRHGVQEAQAVEPKFGPASSAPTTIVSRADAATIAKLTAIKEAIIRVAADDRGYILPADTARAITRAIVANKIPHVIFQG